MQAPHKTLFIASKENMSMEPARGKSGKIPCGCFARSQAAASLLPVHAAACSQGAPAKELTREMCRGLGGRRVHLEV